MKNLFLVILVSCITFYSNASSKPASDVPNLDVLTFFSPETIVQKQLRAYNSRNLEKFIACFSDDVKVYSFPNKMLYEGKDKLKSNYETFFNNTPGLSADLIERTVTGNRVMDKVLISRVKGAEATKAHIMYEVEDGLIAKMYFIN